MYDKFQKRFIRTIFIISSGIIILSILLDSNKKYNYTKFTDIPLVPKIINKYKIESIDKIDIKYIIMPLENITKNIYNSKNKLTNNINIKQYINSNLDIKLKQISSKLQQRSKINKNIQIPQAKAYVIQLAILKNTKKTKEIISKLRLFGYQVYTEPLLLTNRQLTRILIGPNILKEKLQSNLSELKDLTGLQGKIYNYIP
ncbi:MAG: cell division protein DedD [Arsenophonus endosymbiont of Ceratovacuna japonica]